MLANLTVEEMLQYTAELKNPMLMPLSAKLARVDAVLQQLALTGCRDVRIGSPLSRGISGACAFERGPCVCVWVCDACRCACVCACFAATALHRNAMRAP